MDRILEPVFLNEGMLLNTAAHLFEGYSLKEERSHDKEKSGKAEVSVGVTLLSKLFSPISASGEMSAKGSSSIKSERLFTLGGLHMSVIKELKKESKLQLKPLNTKEYESRIRDTSFLSANVILKPVDFYEIIQLLTLLRPLLVKLFDEFGDQLFAERASLKVLSSVELPKYDEMIKSLLKSLEDDYLKSRQLEMVMTSVTTGKPVGVLDIPLGEYDPLEMKSKPNDGQFYVVGKLIRYVEKDSTLNLMQRSSFSKVIDLLGKFVSISDQDDAVGSYNDGLNTAKSIVEKFVRLTLPGPSVRLLALSISA